MIIRERYMDNIRDFIDKPVIKVITGAYVKIGLNQEKPYKTRV